MSMDGCGDASAVSGRAAELFQLAALLMADQAEAVELVEQTVASVEIDPCQDPALARRITRERMIEGAVERLRAADPASFAGVPAVSAAGALCVEDEDLSATGISQTQLAEWLTSGGREDLRLWLAALPAAQRAIFVQRAVLGYGNSATAETLGGPGDSKRTWTPEAVGETYRLALCSLANSLAHSPGALVEEGAPVAT